ncbi:glycoside hydrolase family 16 protein [Zopfia rhizophila CBS 207.26]|uniref:Glycoside hydrolase family 16 protein n=1 Tax=Zopfia rhizophila CBS 207.26 TaxID=1314779 RepID=A0A6A6DAH1_9PEZI|nr:glycoside hydrolase family 16 protein [Zopfia rhizophila CBS 207.26]
MPVPGQPNYTIVWSDDFSGPKGSSPDTSKWDIVNRGPNEGNREVQTYTSSTNSASLSGNGALHITPQKDNNGHWTSARLEGKSAFSCPDGHRMILQAELRTGTFPFDQQAGIWPAFWALGKNIRNNPSVPWPECGEWDVMENAHGVDYTLASLHYGLHGGEQISQGGPSAKKTFTVEAFHTFAIKINRGASDWLDEKIQWYVDGENFYTVTGAQVNDPVLWGNIAHKAFFPILNVAVGSNFPAVGGQPDSKTVGGLGGGMQVKYVAFYKSN